VTAKSIRLRTLAYSLAPDPDTGLPRQDAGAPEIWGHVERQRWHLYWRITAGPYGPVLGFGWTWTTGGAWVKALAASHRPGIEREAKAVAS